MKYFFSFLFLIGFSFSALTQIEVSVETLPDAGDILIFENFDLAGDTLSYRVDGPNQNWQYGNFEITGEDTLSFIDIAETEFVDSFPTADLIFSPIGFRTAAKRNTNSLELTGIVNPQLDFIDLDGTTQYDSPFEYARAPINYEDSFEDDANLFFTFSAALIPGIDSIEVPIDGASIDSIRFVIAQTKMEEATAWGTLGLNGQSFDVLKVTQVDNFDTALEIGLNLFDNIIWFDASDFLGDDGFDFGFQSSKTYKFLNADSKEPILSFTEVRNIDTLGQVQISVSGRSKSGILTSVESPPQIAIDLVVFPNPVHDVVQLIYESDPSIKAELIIRNQLGQALIRRSDYRTADIVQVGHLPKGSYLIELKVGPQQSIKKMLKLD